eukprot:IDg3282t1
MCRDVHCPRARILEIYLVYECARASPVSALCAYSSLTRARCRQRGCRTQHVASSFLDRACESQVCLFVCARVRAKSKYICDAVRHALKRAARRASAPLCDRCAGAHVRGISVVYPRPFAPHVGLYARTGSGYARAFRNSAPRTACFG